MTSHLNFCAKQKMQTQTSIPGTARIILLRFHNSHPGAHTHTSHNALSDVSGDTQWNRTTFLAQRTIAVATMRFCGRKHVQILQHASNSQTRPSFSSTILLLTTLRLHLPPNKTDTGCLITHHLRFPNKSSTFQLPLWLSCTGWQASLGSPQLARFFSQLEIGLCST